MNLNASLNTDIIINLIHSSASFVKEKHLQENRWQTAFPVINSVPRLQNLLMDSRPAELTPHPHTLFCSYPF